MKEIAVFFSFFFWKHLSYVKKLLPTLLLVYGVWVILFISFLSIHLLACLRAWVSYRVLFPLIFVNDIIRIFSIFVYHKRDLKKTSYYSLINNGNLKWKLSHKNCKQCCIWKSRHEGFYREHAPSWYDKNIILLLVLHVPPLSNFQHLGVEYTQIV